MRRNVGLGLLLASALVALVVAALPGTTSAFSAPAPLSSDFQPPTSPMMLPVTSQEVTVGHPPLRAPSYFAQGPLVSIYGHPGICFMGELGCHDTDGAVARARELASQFDVPRSDVSSSFPRYAIPALHLIVDVAQPTPQPDGTYLARMPLEDVRAHVEAARAAGLLLFLDVQVGWSDPLHEVALLEEFLREPFVHIGLDPEFATKSYGRPPGSVIGTLTVSQVRPVQAYLARLAAERGLPPKILVLHQFTPLMLVGMADLEDSPDVDLVVDMDGFGGQPEKLGGYNRYARSSYAEYSGFKLFFHWDTPLFTPAQLMALDGPPHYIVYQ